MVKILNMEHKLKTFFYFQLSELSATVGVGVGPCFQSIKDDISTDLEGIKMEDLSLGCDFIREYLSPPSLPTNTQHQHLVYYLHH